MGLNEKFFRSADEDEPFFNTVLYTGNGGTNEVTGVGFQPDLVWIKRRNGTGDPGMVDTLRGNNSALFTNSTSAESTLTSGNISMDVDGFDINTYGSTWANLSSGTYAAWCWKAGGAPSVSNPFMIDETGYSTASAAGLDDVNGVLTSASINTNSGFGIYNVEYASNEYTTAFKHGLGQTPELVITKVTDGTSVWYVIADNNGSNDRLKLNTTDGFSTDPYFDVSSTTIETGYSSGAYDMIAYAFTSKTGVSKVGSYTGANSSVFVNTGFEPAFVMIKFASGSIGYGGWFIYDNKRDTTNPVSVFLQANTNATEFDNSSYSISFNSTGFTVGSTQNDGINYNNNEYIYYAIAEGTVLDSNPFSLDYLIVAGGGGGGNYYYAGGGGAGGMLTSYGTGNISGGLQPVAATPTLDTGIEYTVTVGAGGGGASTGNNSVFNTVTSTGGGYGAGGSSVGAVAGTGGSGGGGDDYGAAILGGARTSSPIQGFAGGSNPATDNRTGSGGGGAGSTGIGSNASVSLAGLGGDGLASSITGSSVVYAAGGGAAQNATNFGVVGQDNGGSSGIGGKGARYTTNSLDAPSLGDINTGSGGGGGCHAVRHPNGAGGGAGVVVLRYPSSRTITLSVGLTGTTATDGTDKVTVITEGTGTVSFA